MADFTMPSLGADMDEGTLLEWKVAVGDHVDRGDIVAVVDTEKSTIEVEVFDSGVIEELLVAPGTKVAVGTPLAHIRSSEHHDPKVLSPVVRRLAGSRGVDVEHLAGTGVGHRITRDDVERAADELESEAGRHDGLAGSPANPEGGSSPWARRRAAGLGVAIDSVRGSGPGGAVRARDVDATAGGAPGPTTQVPEGDAAGDAVIDAARAPGAAPGARSATERQTSMRQAIARLMAKANREIPHYHLTWTVDLHETMGWLVEQNADRPVARRLLPAAVLLRATAVAASRHPELNGFWIDDRFQPADGVHLGVAIHLRGGGLVAPAIARADERSVDDIMEALKDLVARARQGTLRGSEVSGASLTVTNLGDRGAESVLGVIHPPQVALVGFGRIVERPWAVDGMVGVRPTVTVTLSADHRATDGHVGSRLLETIDDLLARPAQL